MAPQPFTRRRGLQRTEDPRKFANDLRRCRGAQCSGLMPLKAFGYIDRAINGELKPPKREDPKTVRIQKAPKNEFGARAYPWRLIWW